MHYKGYCYAITRGAFPVSVLAAMQKHLVEAEQSAKSWVVQQCVATAREGFNRVLAESGLTGVDPPTTTPRKAAGGI